MRATAFGLARLRALSRVFILIFDVPTPISSCSPCAVKSALRLFGFVHSVTDTDASCAFLIRGSRQSKLPDKVGAARTPQSTVETQIANLRGCTSPLVVTCLTYRGRPHRRKKRNWRQPADDCDSRPSSQLLFPAWCFGLKQFGSVSYRVGHPAAAPSIG